MPHISKSVENGIERIVYTPDKKRFKTPIVMQHGMWHGAWCWQAWQELFAEWGWVAHAYSLPGHAGSPLQRPLRRCTLGYYLEFLTAEIEQQAEQPILIGHSMGGALAQWYLKQKGDLPAAVFVAPWRSHNMIIPILRTVKRDPWGAVLTTLTMTTAPLVRNSYRTFQMFLTDGAQMSPAEIQAKIGPESLAVLYQHTPYLGWKPADPANIQTPMLWIAGGGDVLISEKAERKSAAYYGADYLVVPDEGHNLMMEKSYQETARSIHNWLVQQNIP